ncbi:hypothetical protein D3C85_463440 [compost metagenome]
MPRHTISASQSTDVSINGTTATTTARQLRKVMKHSTITAPYTYTSMVRLASRTTMLVAASIPALPAASMNWRSPLLCSRAKAPATLTTCSRVCALWSAR